MKLVLDEHYSQTIAVGLRDRGHDVVSVHERADMEGLEDEELFRLSASETRALVTENWNDYQREMREAAFHGRDHYGVLFTSRKRLPRGKQTVGLFIRVIGEFLDRQPAEDALHNASRWLPEPCQEHLLR